MNERRPHEYSEDIAKAICARLAEGESLTQVCRDLGMPTRSTVYVWVEANEDFAKRFDRARLFGYQCMADELLDIADNGENDWMDREVKSGRMERVVDHEHIQRSRVRVDTRKWVLAKMLPRVYGDKLDLTNSDQSLSGAFARLIAEEAGVTADDSDRPRAARSRPH